MWTVPDGPVNHVPSPAIRPMIAVARRNTWKPLTATMAPSTRNGIVLAIRCPNPLWRNGDQSTPSRPLHSAGTMPKRSRRPSSGTSTTSVPHMTASISSTGRTGR